uniref:Sporulation related domain-containing protein n=1 Tax=Candidatus Kentrum sp. TUN TaxID=2126343 RepID=A0A450ZIG6_9GAMM|nr:MAG: Sporulation related domain-containing protein [Candidatus Kentron sp. TUN]VFK54274.1 MAG: Sporulation related domain-containing protein [Candidatus Kentron sp. TUN]VFK55131.1 MAG: Sporulation related domain-containing protein [Candidatus Kentron sp. TUN]
MARDYKYAGKSSSPLSGKLVPVAWVWFLSGLLIGLFIAALTYLNMRYSANEVQRHVGIESRLQSVHPPEVPEKPKSATKIPKPIKPEKEPEPRFEFYTILPEREIRVPEHELRSQQPQTPKKTETDRTPSRTSGRYILQVGSFRHLEDADRLKANLVLGGFDVEIQTVSMSGGDTWHRVRLGPYKDLGAVHRIQAELQKNGFAPLVLKEKD